MFLTFRINRRIILLLIILLAFASRVFRLSDASVWWDEGIAIWQARMPILNMMRWTSVDVHPPFYFGLLHFWMTPTGESEFAIRFLSALAGTLTVVVLWRLGRLLFPARPEVALLAAGFLAFSRFAVWWSQEARMYMLGGLLFTLSLYFTVRLRHKSGWFVRLGYLLSTIAALWTLYLLAFTLIIEGLYWLWTLRRLPWARRWSRLGEWALYQIIVLASFMPWLLYALPRMRTWSVQQTPFDLAVYLNLYGFLLLTGASLHVERFRVLILAASLLITVGVITGWLQQRRPDVRDGVLLLIMSVTVPLAVVWFATTTPRSLGYSPKPEARYLLPFTPPVYLLASWAFFALVDRLPRPRGRLALTASLIALMLLGQGISLRAYYAGRYLRDDYKSVALTLAAHLQPGDIVFLHTDHPWPVFAYHWPRDFEGWPNGQDADPASVEHWLAPLWETHQGFWLTLNEDALRADHDQLVEKWLAAHTLVRREWRFGSKRVILFARTPARANRLLALAPGWTPPPPEQPLSTPWLRVIGWEQPLWRVKAGDLAHFAITIQRNALPADATLTVMLGDPALAQTSVIIPAGDGPVRLPVTLVVPSNVAGRYDYIVRIDDARAIMGWVQIFDREEKAAPIDVQPQHQVDASFGRPPLARLLGYSIAGDLTPGGSLALTLYWRVESTTPLSWKVFVHLIGPDSRPAAQGDDFPLGGERSTTSWQPGEILRDDYTVQLPADMPSGEYPLRIGFYDPVSGDRLSPVLDAQGAPQPDDQLQLDVIQVK